MSNYQGQFIKDAPNNPWNKVFDLVKPKSKVLDIGCSNGNFGEALVKLKSCVVDGVEMDSEDAELAKQKLRKVYNGSVEEALTTSFFKDRYEFITFLDVIEHLYRPASTLMSLKPILNENGSVLFSIPNMAHVSVRLMLLKGKFDYGDTGLLDNTHLHFYTKKEIERVFGEAGFRVTDWDYTEAIYTEDLIRKELARVGINSLSDDLLKVLCNFDAKVFQYIGQAKLDKQTSQKRVHYSPDPQGVISSWFEQREKALMQEVENKDAKIAKLTEEYELLSAENNEHKRILNSEKELFERTSLRRHLRYGLKRRLRRNE